MFALIFPKTVERPTECIYKNNGHKNETLLILSVDQNSTSKSAIKVSKYWLNKHLQVL